MSSFPRTLSRLLGRQSPATATTVVTGSKTCRTTFRTAQTQAAPSTLRDTHPPPTHAFQHQQHIRAQNPTSPPKTPTASDNLKNYPLIHTLRQDPSLKETRPHLSMPASLRPSHLVAGSLSGDGKLAEAPYIFLSRQPSSPTTEPKAEQDPSQSRAVAVFHVGKQMCGHPGYVHGGFLSVMFDEVFAHTVSQAFASGTGMTANLNVDFRKPALPGRVYVLRAETVKVEGRKAWVEGKLMMMPLAEEGEAVMVAEARALFVEPKFAESMVSVYRN
ncbi:HotDog domain-containing protein [Aspergillus californicus]